MTLKAAAPSSSQEACKIPWVFCESWFGKLVKQSHHLHFNWNGDPLLLHKWKKKPKRQPIKKGVNCWQMSPPAALKRRREKNTNYIIATQNNNSHQKRKIPGN
jgi:hypothetical protein